MSLCGLHSTPALRRKQEAKADKGKGKERPLSLYTDEYRDRDPALLQLDEDLDEWDENSHSWHRASANPDRARRGRADHLSTILENFEDSGSRRDASWAHPPISPTLHVRPRSLPTPTAKQHRPMSSMDIPRPISGPPRDLESIAYIDKSLVFEQFTTDDAWELGSALRNRLLPIHTPVVVNIALANKNQVLFHTCTHPGVMPDNDNLVSRKRNTVLRWGCSTWFMHCKFEGDEFAFRDKYGLGDSAGDYSIHGGGVPIRVTGVEGVVAVVVVSGLKQHEDHAVIVEVIRELYY